jgi:large subunit ribosomal protein L2
MLNYFFFRLNFRLIKGKCFSGGRNFLGRVCIVGRGGGNKRFFRILDSFKRLSLFGLVCKIIYDSRRTAPIVCILYENGLVAYSVLIDGLKLGSTIFSGYCGLFLLSNSFGWSVPISNVKLFSLVSNLELYPFSGSKLIRSGGTSGILIGKSDKNAVVKLRSGWVFYVSLNSFAVFGRVSTKTFAFEKAGKMRAFGFRSKVRGVAKNPCDHPHGGGNGKKSKPVVPVNAWGRFFKWKPTKNTKKDRLKRRLFKFIN